MSWENLLQDPSFRGVPLEVLSTSLQGGKDLAEHKVPYTNGAESNDMGNAARGIEYRVIVRGENYEADMSRLEAALDMAGPGELVDPIKGAMTVLVSRWSIEHDAETRDACQVSIRFVVQGRTALLFSLPAAGQSADLADAAGQQARAAAAAQASEVVAKAASSAIPRIAAINDALAQAKAKLRKLLDTTSVRVLLSDLDPLIYPQAALADLMAIADAAFQGLPFGGLNALYQGNADLDPDASAMQAAQADFARLVAAHPANILITAVGANDADQAVADAITAMCRVTNATMVCNAAGMVLAAELQLLGLSADDIERVLATARNALQVAMTSARELLGGQAGAQVAGQLAAQAKHLQDAAHAALEQRPPVVRKPAPVGGTARLVAHALYGDHTRALELVRLNGWGRQVLIDAGQEMLAYAR
jgi:prophage DNA circulation protein